MEQEKKWFKKAYSSLSGKTGQALRRKESEAKHQSENIFEEYIADLKNKKESFEPIGMWIIVALGECDLLVCHVHVMTDKNNWKLMGFHPNSTVEDALKQIATKIHLKEDTWQNYCLSLDNGEVLSKTEKRLSSYNIKSGVIN